MLEQRPCSAPAGAVDGRAVFVSVAHVARSRPQMLVPRACYNWPTPQKALALQHTPPAQRSASAGSAERRPLFTVVGLNRDEQLSRLRRSNSARLSNRTQSVARDCFHSYSSKR